MTEPVERRSEIVGAEDVARRFALQEREMILEAGILGRFLVQRRVLRPPLRVLSHYSSHWHVLCHFLCLQTYQPLNSGNWCFL